MAKCRSCHADLTWVTMEGSGKANPLDVEPVENGNVEVYVEDGRPMGRVVTDASDRPFAPPLHLSHFKELP
jgi:hypothetical protein